MSQRSPLHIFALIIGAVCLSGKVSGQAAEPVAKFAVADVHPSADSTNPDTWGMSGGLMRGGFYYLKRATMLDLIRIAYDVYPQKVIGGPSWLDVSRFDVRATVPPDATAATVNTMLQALLADRFGLVIRHDEKQVPAWVLTAGKHPRLKQSDGSGAGSCRDEAHGEEQQAVHLFSIACRNLTMADFAAHLNDMVDGAWRFTNHNVIVDQTGLEGAWDFDFKFSERDLRIKSSGVEIVTLFDALEKIGLKLEPAAVPMPAIVVQRVNQTPTPNSPEASAAFPPQPTEFEAAAVKMTDPDFHGTDFHLQPGGRLTVRGVTLKFLVKLLWGLTDDMLVGAPKFMDSDRWDIIAKISGIAAQESDVDADALYQMEKNLLADRFKLVLHTEERLLPSFALTATKPKMKKADPASRTGCNEGPPTLMRVDPRNANPVLGRLISCTNTTIAYLADQLQYLANDYVNGPVLDSTDLEGGWDFTLSFSSAAQLQGSASPSPGTAPSADPNGAVSLPEALEKQLGLKLERVKRQLPVLVIDHIGRKPTDN